MRHSSSSSISRLVYFFCLFFCLVMPCFHIASLFYHLIRQNVYFSLQTNASAQKKSPRGLDFVRLLPIFLHRRTFHSSNGSLYQHQKVRSKQRKVCRYRLLPVMKSQHQQTFDSSIGDFITCRLLVSLVLTFQYELTFCPSSYNNYRC